MITIPVAVAFAIPVLIFIFARAIPDLHAVAHSTYARWRYRRYVSRHGTPAAPPEVSDAWSVLRRPED
jgi:hypothetical protein